MTSKKNEKPTLELLKKKLSFLEDEKAIANILLTTSEENVYADLLDYLLNIFESEFGYIGYINQKGDLICPSMTRNVWDKCQVPQKSICFSKAKWAGLWGKSLFEKKSFLRNKDLSFPMGHIELKRTLIVPIIYKKSLIGQIVLADKKSNYHNDDLQKLNNISDYLAPILKIRLERNFATENVKKSEELLSRLNLLLNETEKISKVGGWEWNLKTQEMYWTKETYAIHGFNTTEKEQGSKELIDKSLKCYDNKSKKIILEAFNRCVSAGEPYELETEFTNYNGKKIWIRTIGKAIKEEGKVVKVIGNIVDITVEKQENIALTERESFLKAIFNNSLNAILVTDDNGNYISANKAASELFGYSVNKLLKMNVRDLNVINTIEITDQFKTYLKKGKDKGEFYFYDKNGNHKVAHYNAIKISKNFNLSILTNITEQKKNEISIKENEQFLKSIYDSLSHSVFVIDVCQNGKPKFTYRGLNRYHEKITGIKNKDLVGKTPEEILIKESAAVVTKNYNKCLTASAKITYEEEFILNNTNTFWETTLNPIKDKDGKIYRIIGTSRDVTEEKRAQQEAANHQKNLQITLDGLSANIAMLDETGKIILVNKAWREFASENGETPNNVSENINYLDVCDNASGKFNKEAKPFAEGIRRVISGELPYFSMQYPCNSPKKERWFLGKVTSLAAKGKKQIVISHENITELKLAQKQIIASEKKYKSTFNSAPLSIFISNKNGKIIEVNKRVCELLGYTLTEIVNKNIADITYHEDIKLSKKTIKQSVSKEAEYFSIVKRYLHKNGNIIWGNVSIKSFFDESGNFVYNMGIVEDITDKVITDNELKKTNDKIKSILTAAPIGIGLVVNRVFEEVNDNFCKMIGFSRKELIGQNARMIYPSDIEYEFVGKEKYNLIAQKDIGEVVTKLKCKNGKIIDVSMKSTPIDKNDLSKGVTFSVEDITEKIRIENELKLSEERYKSSFNLAPFGIVLADQNMNIIDCNEQFIEILGYSKKEIKDKSIKEITYKEDIEESKKQFNSSINGKINSFQVIKRYVCKNGNIIWGKANVRAIYDNNGKFLNNIATIENITEKKKAEEELKLSEDKFRKAFITSPDAMNINRRSDGMFVSINNAFLKISGYKLKEVIGKTSIELNVWEDPNDRLKLVKGLEKKGYVENLEANFKMKNGKIINGLMSASIIQINGEDCLLSITRDITDRKIIEQKLKESEENYQHIIHGMQDMVFVIDWNGKIMDVNNSAIKNLGYSKDELINLSLTKLDSSLSLKEIKKLLKNFPTEKIQSFQTKHLTKDKKEIPVEIQSTVIKYQGKSVILSIARDISFRKLAEEKIKASEENLKSFFNNVDELIFILDDKGNIIETNETVEKRLGYKKNELLNKPILSVHPPKRKNEVIKIVQEMIEGKRENCPIPLITKDKKLVPVETHIKKGIWEGKPAVFGTSKDITEIVISEEKFSKAFHNNPAIAGFIDLETGKYIQVNETFYNKLEFTPEEVIGKRASEVIKMDIGFPNFALEKLKEKTKVENLETIIYSKSGKPLNVLLNAEIIEVNEQKYNFTTAIDITQRKKYEDELRIFSQAVRQSQVSIVITDIEGRVEYVNPKFTEVTGYSFLEVLGEKTSILKSGLMDNKFYDDLWDTIKSGKVWIGVFNNKKKNGDIFSESAIISPIKNSKNEIEHFVALKEDITEKVIIDQELKRYQNDLEELVRDRTKSLEKEIKKREKAEKKVKSALEKEIELGKLKSSFISTVSHEFRTPLTSIYSSLELVERYSNKWDKNKVNEHYGRIKNSIEHLTNILEEILKLNRSQTGRVEFNPELTDLNLFCSEIVADFEIILANKQSLQYSYSLPETAYIVDKYLLKIILSNLISNAIKFSHEEGLIKLNLSINNNWIQFKIKDDGIGISNEDLNKVFDPFYRSSSVSTIPGSGLGLSITKSYVEVHKGNIKVTSKQNEGAEFTVLIPLITETK